jgi:ABC-type lipoprotein release transport system permease subunit
MSITDSTEESKTIEIRKVQALVGERSLVLVLAKSLALQLGIRKGDYMRCFVESNRLVLERV